VPLGEWGTDLASFSAHKIGGPIGVGVLFRRRGVELHPISFGGEQEGGLRPGTENVSGIVGAARAVELAVREREEVARRLVDFSRELWGELARTLAGVELLGLPIDDARRLPGTLSLLAPNQDGKVLVTRLDLEGLACSAGSACASGSLEPSHVLRAIGRTEHEARAGLRLSLGRDSTWTTVREAVDILRRSLGALDAKRARRTSS
jgi:cysteine desulfurase